MRLLLVGGAVMLVVTVLIVVYGFRRTEELQTDYVEFEEQAAP